MRIDISDDVKNSIANIYDYCSNVSPSYASKIVHKIYDSIYDLQFSPYIGRYVPELSNNQYRELIYWNYRIIYFVSEKYNIIFVRYIICSKQNPKIFFNIHKNDLYDFLNHF